MANELHGNGDVRVSASPARERPPAMGWVWGAIGLALLAWLVALFVIGDEPATGTTVGTEGAISSDADAATTAGDPEAVEGAVSE